MCTHPPSIPSLLLLQQPELGRVVGCLSRPTLLRQRYLAMECRHNLYRALARDGIGKWQRSFVPLHQ